MFVVAGLILVCGGKAMDRQGGVGTPRDNVPDGAWERLAKKRIYFGHQSVGYNIVNGIRDVMRENPRLRLNIVETTDPADFASPVLAHSRVGKNKDPGSKCDAFAGYLENGIGEKVDVAFMKMCYVDVSSESDVAAMFDRYRRTMGNLKRKFPRTLFVHVTVPLTSTDTSVRQTVKRWIGRRDIREYANVNRSLYNELLRKEYAGRELIFDLAAVESTSPDGIRRTATHMGKTYAVMHSSYTSDGGHLNESGRRRVASELLTFLANLPG